MIITSRSITIYSTDLKNDIRENIDYLKNNLNLYIDKRLHSYLKWITISSFMLVQDILIKALIEDSPLPVVKKESSFKIGDKKFHTIINEKLDNPVKISDDIIEFNINFNEKNIEYFFVESNKCGLDIGQSELIKIFNDLYYLKTYLNMIKELQKKKNCVKNDKIVNNEKYIKSLKELSNYRNSYIHFYPSKHLIIENDIFIIIYESMNYLNEVLINRKGHFNDDIDYLNNEIQNIKDMLKRIV